MFMAAFYRFIFYLLFLVTSTLSIIQWFVVKGKAIDRISHMGANGINEVIFLGSLTKLRFNFSMPCHFGTSKFII